MGVWNVSEPSNGTRRLINNYKIPKDMSEYKLVYNMLPMIQEVKYDEYKRPTHSILFATVNEIDIGIKVSHKWDSPMSPERAYKLVMEAYSIKSKKVADEKSAIKGQFSKQQDPRELLHVSAFFLGELVKTWNSAQEAANEMGINKRNIIEVCEDTIGRNNSAGGYVWRYTTSYGEITHPSRAKVFTGREKKLLTDMEYLPQRIRKDMQEYEREHSGECGKVERLNLKKICEQSDNWEKKPLLSSGTVKRIEEKIEEILNGRIYYPRNTTDKVGILAQYLQDGLLSIWFYPNKARLVLRFIPYGYGEEQTDEYKRFIDDFNKICEITEIERIGSDAVFIFKPDKH